MKVRRAEARDEDAVAALFAGYAAEYAYELGDQDVVGEGQRARATYGEGLFVADDGVVLGCVAYEDWGHDPQGRRRCRMKRMYVPPAGRGHGVGRALAEGVLAAAKEAGYEVMVLDTSGPMEAALALYRSLGFAEVEADWDAPCRDVVYLALRL